MDPSTPTLAEKFAERHAATVQLLVWLQPNIKLPVAGLVVANQIAVIADRMVAELPDGPELSTGLRKLLEAKDCFVRAALSLT